MRGDRIATSVDRPNLLALLEASPDGILLLDLEGRVQFASRRVAAMLRLGAPHRLVGRSVFDFILPKDRPAATDMIRSVRSGEKRDLHEYRVQCCDGTVMWTEWNAELFSTPGRHELGVLVVIRDADRRKKSERALIAAKQNAEAELRRLQSTVSELQLAAWTDRLTGVGNRRQFELVAEMQITDARQYGEPVSLVLVDVDHFKRINDRHGHRTGDDVLVMIVKTMLEWMRSCDTLCRWGGEEFVVIAPGTTGAEAMHIAERLRMRVAENCISDAGHVTISAGVAELGPEEDREIWLSRADRALYAAKKSGRNRCVLDPMARPSSGPRLVKLLWRPAFECGDPLIDRQHRALFELGNALLDQAIKCKSLGGVQAQVDGLLAELERHFLDEEALLERIAFPGREQHRQLHALLLKEARTVPDQVRNGTQALPALIDFLVRRVIFDHVIHADREFSPFVTRGSRSERAANASDTPPRGCEAASGTRPGPEAQPLSPWTSARTP